VFTPPEECLLNHSTPSARLTHPASPWPGPSHALTQLSQCPPPPPLPNCPCPQLFAHIGAKDAAELRLVSTDLPAATVFADEAMVSDFPLDDESVIYACVGGEEPPKAH